MNRQHRLAYYVRGPEWAFAIPAGDLDALDEVMRLCSGFWNGPGSLLVPVGADGRLPDFLEDPLLASRPVEMCFVHERVSDAGEQSVTASFASSTRLLPGTFDESEVHPLHLLPADHERRTLEVPASMSRWHARGWRYGVTSPTKTSRPGVVGSMSSRLQATRHTVCRCAGKCPGRARRRCCSLG